PFTDKNPLLQVKRLYENYADTSYRPGALPESKATVLPELNLGYGLCLHVGHGFRNSMSVGDVTIVNSDAASLTNGSKLFNLYAIDCTSNAIDFPCIGEAFLKNPNGGAVTVVGSTRFDFPTAGRAYQQEYFRLFFNDSASAGGRRAAGTAEAAVRGVLVLRRREPLDADDAARAGRPRAAHVQRQSAPALGERGGHVRPRRHGVRGERQQRRQPDRERACHGVQGRRRLPHRLHRRLRRGHAAVPPRLDGRVHAPRHPLQPPPLPPP